MPISDLDWAFRFLPKVQPRDANGCLLWERTERNGYGQFKLDGRMVYVHRVAYEYHYGPIPEGLVVDHVFARGCRSKLCVNPQHLEAVTHAENMARAAAATRWLASIEVATELDAG